MERPSGSLSRPALYAHTSQQRIDDGAEFEKAKWFDQIVVCALAQALQPILKLSARCEHDDPCLWVLFSYTSGGFQSGTVRQHHVQDEYARLRHQGQEFDNGARLKHAMSAIEQEVSQFLTQRELVFQKNNGRHVRGYCSSDQLLEAHYRRQLRGGAIGAAADGAGDLQKQSHGNDTSSTTRISNLHKRTLALRPASFHSLERARKKLGHL
jgi:hypothetical protein